MNCQEAHKLIHGYVDSELDLTTSLEIDQHLQECAACAQAYTDLQAVRTAIKDRAPYFQAPSSLQKRIQSSVRKASEAGPATNVRPWRLLAIAASLALVLITGWGLIRVWSHRSADSVLTQQLIALRVRSEMLANHRFDVESSDQHTVKPWFAGKVDFSPSVPDLSDERFSLVGGRLEYLDNRAVAALVYQRRKHFIDLFMWPSAPGAEAATKSVTRQGYHLFYWTQSGMNYWAVSDLNETELEEFVRLVQMKVR